MKVALYKNRKFLKDYQGKTGFISMMKNSFLDKFIAEDGTPKLLFKGISNAARDFRPESLPAALRQYHDFMVPTVEWRSKKILERLRYKLNLE